MQAPFGGGAPIQWESTGGVGLMKAPFGGGAPIQWGGEGADYFYPTMFDI